MKKIAKIAGNLLMICAVAFLIKKIVDMDADLSQLLSPPVMGAFFVNLTVQTLLVAVGCFPWMVFTQSLSGKKIPFSSAMPVYTKSNVYKYLPGNVFQYVGRNKLAFDMNISHVDVACATILDILFCVFLDGHYCGGSSWKPDSRTSGKIRKEYPDNRCGRNHTGCGSHSIYPHKIRQQA